jgi:hypothetical protein
MTNMVVMPPKTRSGPTQSKAMINKLHIQASSTCSSSSKNELDETLRGLDCLGCLGALHFRSVQLVQVHAGQLTPDGSLGCARQLVAKQAQLLDYCGSKCLVEANVLLGGTPPGPQPGSCCSSIKQLHSAIAQSSSCIVNSSRLRPGFSQPKLMG